MTFPLRTLGKTEWKNHKCSYKSEQPWLAHVCACVRIVVRSQTHARAEPEDYLISERRLSLQGEQICRSAVTV